VIGEIVKLRMPCAPIFRESMQENNGLAWLNARIIRPSFNIMDNNVFNVDGVMFHGSIHLSTSINLAQ
jgi:hypothetical protein